MRELPFPKHTALEQSQGPLGQQPSKATNRACGCPLQPRAAQRCLYDCLRTPGAAPKQVTFVICKQARIITWCEHHAPWPRIESTSP
jgi:hypothetical protein